MRRQLALVLEAEQEAAAVTRRRRRTLRDRLLDAEDRREAIWLSCLDRRIVTGPVIAVGTDHVVIETQTGSQFIALSHIVAIGAADR